MTASVLTEVKKKKNAVPSDNTKQNEDFQESPLFQATNITKQAIQETKGLIFLRVDKSLNLFHFFLSFFIVCFEGKV